MSERRHDVGHDFSEGATGGPGASVAVGTDLVPLAGGLKIIDATMVERLLPMWEAVEVLDSAFADGLPASPLRPAFRAGAAELLLMPSWGTQGVGVKIVTVAPANADRGLPTISGAYVLFDPETQALSAVLDGQALTSLRTAAVSGVATHRLSPPQARDLVIFGAGAQARAHLESMVAVRGIRSLVVVSRNRDRAEGLLTRGRELGLEVRVGSPADVASADIICTTTTSATPVFSCSDLQSVVHINAVGSHHPAASELDVRTMAGASVWVEDRATAAREAGDVIQAVDAGMLSFDAVGELAELCRGSAASTGRAERTVFKSVGLAGEDLVLAAEIVRRHELEASL